MYFSSKTESFQPHNYHPNQLFQNQTLTTGIIANDVALTKAIQIIQQLKQNLTYALKVNQNLLLQNQQLKSNAQRTNKKVNADVMNWQKKYQQIENQKQQIVQLLEESKRTLLATQQQYEQLKFQLQKCNRIIYEQKKSYEQLQQQFMNQTFNQIGNNSSMNLNKSDLLHITEMERQNQQLSLQIKKLTQQLQKNQGKMIKIEKQNNQFKKWMATVLGLHKVVQGTQKILMNQISQRILSS